MARSIFNRLAQKRGLPSKRDVLPSDLEAFVQRARRATALPLCVGFGISGAEAARRVAQVADGVIVGSRLIQVIKEARDPVKAASAFVRELRWALDSE